MGAIVGAKPDSPAVCGRTRIVIILYISSAGEARLARRVRRTRIVIIRYISSAGEACLAPTKPCGSKAIEGFYCPYRSATLRYEVLSTRYEAEEIR